MTYLIYIGKNKGTIPGVPARDLTEAEAKNYGVALLLKSNLYIVRKNLSEMEIVYPQYNEEDKPRRYKRRKE